jgi:hypothetical protein
MQVLISVFVVSVKRQVEPSAARSDRRVSDEAPRTGWAAVTVVIF